jgi:hypothetical protein
LFPLIKEGFFKFIANVGVGTEKEVPSFVAGSTKN